MMSLDQELDKLVEMGSLPSVSQASTAPLYTLPVAAKRQNKVEAR